ncbi:hypothetical protein SAMD00019534_071630 [Acytostelium subglobosum LB1]|uniref:hypothetical protein n=1 Tax=Acytostelium subglobosum LB1 TaxID=1410327 RepID=UPI000644C465|nr:hypothetical protein SAMD00019534_071630 [Acytostelium subglobosum LB1]GAM23988.1 hypothetical protein SAMD00019534_071630 [Acytostelium subglobosum LB1]|eukprot:XP_012753024.1 hypothetical protein SAMD00019534_071630 [Acytostelium subglobosum LB1]
MAAQDSLLVIEKEKCRRLELELDEWKRRAGVLTKSDNDTSGLPHGSPQEQQQHQLTFHRSSSSDSTESLSENEDTPPPKDLVIVEESEASSTLMNQLEVERAQLRQWEDRLISEHQRCKELIQSIKDQQQQQRPSSTTDDKHLQQQHVRLLETKIVELQKSLDNEHKQRMKLEESSNHSSPSPSTPTQQPAAAGTSFLASSSNKFSFFSKRNLSLDFSRGRDDSAGEEQEEQSQTPPSSTAQITPPNESETDQERKARLFNSFNQLLVDCNSILYVKKEQLMDMEEKGGYFKKLNLNLHALKSSVGKLDNLQERIKRCLKTIDSKESVTYDEELEEKITLKSMQAEIDQER